MTITPNVPEQFGNQFHGRIILDSIDIKETSVDEIEVYAADGLLSRTIYIRQLPRPTIILLFQKSWDKGKEY